MSNINKSECNNFIPDRRNGSMSQDRDRVKSLSSNSMNKPITFGTIQLRLKNTTGKFLGPQYSSTNIQWQYTLSGNTEGIFQSSPHNTTSNL